jgi:hypothetical protein
MAGGVRGGSATALSHVHAVPAWSPSATGDSSTSCLGPTTVAVIASGRAGLDWLEEAEAVGESIVKKERGCGVFQVAPFIYQDGKF